MYVKTKMKYIGENKSRGFRTGKIYDVKVYVNTYLWVEESKIFRPKSCPYTRPETLKDNWVALDEQQGKRIDVMWIKER